MAEYLASPNRNTNRIILSGDRRDFLAEKDSPRFVTGQALKL